MVSFISWCFVELSILLLGIWGRRGITQETYLHVNHTHETLAAVGG